MTFVMRCLGIKDVNKPIASRCKNSPNSKNGILCNDCLNKAKKGKINILMHKDVTKIFKIPFKNQVFVSINLSNKSKPESSSVIDDKIRQTKNILTETMSTYEVDRLKMFHDKLKMDCWDSLSKTHKDNKYSFKYFMVKSIVETLYKHSISI